MPYREKRLGPKTPLQCHRFNLIALGLSYSVIGFLFHWLDLTRGDERPSQLLGFLGIGVASVVTGLLSLRNAYVSRRTGRLFVLWMILCSVNFAIYAALRDLEGPYFAWSLMGPFGASLSMVTNYRTSTIVQYMWISYGCNVIAALTFGSISTIYLASNILMVVMLVPTLANISQKMAHLKEQRIRAIERWAKSGRASTWKPVSLDHND